MICIVMEGVELYVSQYDYAVILIPGTLDDTTSGVMNQRLLDKV